jgi:hypothetical protein
VSTMKGVAGAWSQNRGGIHDIAQPGLRFCKARLSALRAFLFRYPLRPSKMRILSRPIGSRYLLTRLRSCGGCSSRK